MQYVPEDGVYTYFRYDNKQTIMVVMNTAKEEKKVMMEKFTERTNGFSKMKNILTGKITSLNEFAIKSYESVVYELIK